MKDSDIHKDYAQKISDFFNNLVILGFSYSGQQKSVSAQQSKIKHHLNTRGYSWHNNARK